MADQRCRRLIPLNATAVMVALAVAVVVKDMELQTQPAVLATRQALLHRKAQMAAQARLTAHLVTLAVAAEVPLLLAVME